jgi:error-prone DNA polymerase
MTRYAELHCTSNFSFLRGGSHPHELVEQARALGHHAIAIADLNTLAGIVRGHVAAQGDAEEGIDPIRFVVGCRLEVEVSSVAPFKPKSSCPGLAGASTNKVLGKKKFVDGPPEAGHDEIVFGGERRSLLCFPTSRAAYGRLTRMLTQGKRRAKKAECKLCYEDLVAFGEGQIFVALPPASFSPSPPLGGGEGWGEVGESLSQPTSPSHRFAMGPSLSPQGAERDIFLEFEKFLRRLATDFPRHVYLAAQHLYRGDDAKRLHRLAALAKRVGVPLVATNDVLYHAPARRRLQDVVSCIREGCTLATAGLRLNAHAERHLKSPAEMARLFRGYEDALARTVEIVERCQFSLDELKYDYPDESGGAGTTPQARLESLAWNGAAWRYPEGVPDTVRDQIEKELALIERRDYAPYFLTVHAIVNEARRRDILCQGRGSAANSVVCYCLGVTSVDPTQIDLLFDRFINEERTEPPDIDVDFEHERREEVIQHIYQKYGRDRAALTATVIHYRPRRAIREVGKVLGLSEDVTAALAGTVWGWYGEAIERRHVRELGLDPADPTLALALELATELVGFPRHLSQHVGGFVITRTPLDELVPIENAAMADRTVIEWDKDDIDALRMLKIDILALGMLTAIRRGFDLIALHYGQRYTLATIPKEDPAVYEMLCHADSIGVFQVESRAQMSMLPRLKPRQFYDLVIEVAIVRPGPIQGGMVHPYLRRRAGAEAVDLPSGKEELREILDKTLGVPLFQEQAMRMAMIAARFTGAEANGLRQAMATFRHNGQMPKYKDKFIAGMIANGYEEAFARRCFSQIEGFGEYGFPESHAASFALLVYASAWIKCFYPEIFAAALLNSQPMGFYAPAQLVRDARDHGVAVRPVDVNASHWDCTLEPISSCCRAAVRPSTAPPVDTGGAAQDEGNFSGHEQKSLIPSASAASSRGTHDVIPGHCALRLGFNQVKGLSQAPLEEFVRRRAETQPPPENASHFLPSPAGGGGLGGGYRSIAEVARRGGLERRSLERLAEADAFRSLGLDRRLALWAMKGVEVAPAALFAARPAPPTPDQPAPLPEMPLGEHVIEDYRWTGLSLKAHPLSFLRATLARRGVTPAAALRQRRDGELVTVAGIVLVRQRPGEGKVIFMTLEDETGIANLVVWIPVFERFRRIVMGARLVACTGRLQIQGEVIHVVTERLRDWTPALRRIGAATAPGPAQGRLDLTLPASRDFH